MSKSVINIILIVVFCGLTIVSGLAWINNISIAAEWYRDIEEGKIYKIVSNEKELKKAEDQNIKAKIYHGLMPQLARVSSVDMSTVTTFIPFLGFLLMTIALIKITSWGFVTPKIISEHFPFFRHYDRRMVILGLAGTFWGIIMLGYYPVKVEMSHLMLCIHTAMFSTLVAVLWVFFIAMPGREVMVWWLEKCTGLKVGLEKDITAAFEEFGRTSTEVAHCLKASKEEINSFNEQMSKAKIGFKETLETLNLFKEKTGVDVLESLEETYKNVGASLEKIIKGLESQKEFQKQVVEQQQELIEQNQGVISQYEEELLKNTKQQKEAEERERTLIQQNSAFVVQLGRVKSVFKDLLRSLEQI